MCNCEHNENILNIIFIICNTYMEVLLQMFHQYQLEHCIKHSVSQLMSVHRNPNHEIDELDLLHVHVTNH